MTSTNDGKDVKINQNSGPKGKTFYIELYKSLEAGLSKDSDLSERTQRLCEAWRRVHSLCSHSAASTHPHLLSWLQRHTARTVLQTEWQDPENKDEHKHLEEAIDDFITQSASNSDGGPSWQVQLVARAEWFKTILANPWGHPVLRVLLDPQNKEPPTDAEVLEWLKEERGVMFVTRLRQLASSKHCKDLALELTSAILDKVRACVDPPRDDQPVDTTETPTNQNPSAPSFLDILKAEAGFTIDVIEVVVDIEFVLLHKRDNVARCIELAKLTALRNGYQLVERLVSRQETSPREKKLWKNAKDVATLIAQVMVARCMVVSACTGPTRTALYCCARSLARLLGAARLTPACAALAAPAATARHLHTLALAVDSESKDDMKPFVCELYVRAITAGMNELERLKLNADKEAEARSFEQTLAQWFLQLGSVLAMSQRMCCECTLTAFSVHPSPTMYDKIKAAPALPPVAVDIETKDEQSTSEFGSWANDSRSQTNFVKTSETLKLKHTQHQANVLSTAILTEGEALHLSPELCQDMAVLLSGPRVKTLSWDMDRQLLLENCRTYMERTEFGTRALTTELKYLNLDLREYQHLPEEEDDDSDMYYGIEKGYEHLVEFQEPEEIWEDINDRESAYSSDENTDMTQKSRRKSKKSFGYADDDDPLSTVAEHKGVIKKKERPHSKERSKVPKSKIKSQNPLDDDPIRVLCQSTDTIMHHSNDGMNPTIETQRDPSVEKKNSKKKQGDVNKNREKKKISQTKKKKENNSENNKEPKKKEKKERKRKAKGTNQDLHASLSSLIGMKVTSMEENQVDSSTNLFSGGHGTDVLFDGLFSMDEYKSPEKPDMNEKLMPVINSKSHVANGSFIHNAGRPKFETNRVQTPTLSRTPTPNRRSTETSKSKSVINEEVKNSLTNLLHYRRQKSSSLSPEPRSLMTHQNVQTYSNMINKAQYSQQQANDRKWSQYQSEQFDVLKNEVTNLLNINERKSWPNMLCSPTHKIINNTTAKILNSTLDKPFAQNPSTSKKCVASPETFQLINRQNSTKPLTNQPVQGHQKHFQDFLKNLHSTINPGAASDNNSVVKAQKETKLMDRVNPILTKAEPKVTPCAKQIGKKTEIAPNTFSRLSYYKSNQNNIKTKQLIEAIMEHQSKQLDNLKDADLDRVIAEHKLPIVNYLNSSGETLTKPAKCRDNTHKTSKKSSKSQENSIADQLPSSAKTSVRQIIQDKKLKPPTTLTPVQNKSTSLTEKGQEDLLLLLRQQSNQKLNRLKLDTSKNKGQIRDTRESIDNKPAEIIKPGLLKPCAKGPSLKSPHEVRLNKPIVIRKEEAHGKHTETVIRKAKSNIGGSKKGSTKPQETHKHTDWESVMDALLKHKTPSRGPNALDMALNKDTYLSAYESSLQKPSIFKSPSDTSGNESDTTQMSTTGGVDTDIHCSNSTNIIKRSNCKSKSKQSSQCRNVTNVVIQNNTSSTSLIRKSLDSPSNVAQSKKIHADNQPTDLSTAPKKLPVEQNNQQFTCPLPSEDDPFISGNLNFDYDLLEELIDDDLRQEIGELLSDEDCNAASNYLKDPKSFIAVNKSVTPMMKEGKDCDASTLVTTSVTESALTNINKEVPCHTVSNTVPSTSLPVQPTTTGYLNVNTVNTSEYTNTENHSNYNTNAVEYSNPENNSNFNTLNIVHQLPCSTIVPPQGHNYVNAMSTGDQTFVAVPQQTAVRNVVLIGSDIVYRPCVQTPLHTGLAQNTFVTFNTQPNIAVYQTTRFAAPVINNPVIIGNAQITPRLSASVLTANIPHSNNVNNIHKNIHTPHVIKEQNKDVVNAAIINNINRMIRNEISPKHMLPEATKVNINVPIVENNIKVNKNDIKTPQQLKDPIKRTVNAPNTKKTNKRETKAQVGKYPIKTDFDAQITLKTNENEVIKESKELIEKTKKVNSSIVKKANKNVEAAKPIPKRTINKEIRTVPFKDPIKTDIKKSDTKEKFNSECIKSAENGVVEDDIVTKEKAGMKNSKTRVLSEVADSQKLIDLLKSRNINIKKVSVQHDAKKNSEQERINRKRMTILNRTISHRSYSKPIPLTYTPLKIMDHNIDLKDGINHERHQSSRSKVKTANKVIVTRTKPGSHTYAKIGAEPNIIKEKEKVCDENCKENENCLNNINSEITLNALRNLTAKLEEKEDTIAKSETTVLIESNADVKAKSEETNVKVKEPTTDGPNHIKNKPKVKPTNVIKIPKTLNKAINNINKKVVIKRITRQMTRDSNIVTESIIEENQKGDMCSVVDGEEKSAHNMEEANSIHDPLDIDNQINGFMISRKASNIPVIDMPGNFNKNDGLMGRVHPAESIDTLSPKSVIIEKTQILATERIPSVFEVSDTNAPKESKQLADLENLATEIFKEGNNKELNRSKVNEEIGGVDSQYNSIDAVDISSNELVTNEGQTILKTGNQLFGLQKEIVNHGQSFDPQKEISKSVELDTCADTVIKVNPLKNHVITEVYAKLVPEDDVENIITKNNSKISECDMDPEIINVDDVRKTEKSKEAKSLSLDVDDNIPQSVFNPEIIYVDDVSKTKQLEEAKSVSLDEHDNVPQSVFNPEIIYVDDVRKTEQLMEATSVSLDARDNVPQSFLDAIKVEEMKNHDPKDPLKRCVRIKLPNGRAFKATVRGQTSVNIDTLFGDPALKKVLLNNISSNNRCTLNIKQISTLNKIEPEKVLQTRIQAISVQPSKHFTTGPTHCMETINLLSDDDDDEEADRFQYFNTQFGKYKISMIQNTLHENHQKVFDKKCVVTLKKEVLQVMQTLSPDVITIPDDVQESVIQPICPNLIATEEDSRVKLNQVSHPEVIEIDDSSNDDIDFKEKNYKTISCEEKIMEFKNLLLKDLGVEGVDERSAAEGISTETETGSLEDLIVPDKIINTVNGMLEELIIPDSLPVQSFLTSCMSNPTVSEEDLSPVFLTPVVNKYCFIKLTNCDDLVEKVKLIKACSVKLVRCDDMKYDKLSSSLMEIDNNFEGDSSRSLYRSGSFSILNGYSLVSDQPLLAEYTKRSTSPVMDAFETLVAVRNLKKHDKLKMNKETCETEWFLSKHSLWLQSKIAKYHTQKEDNQLTNSGIGINNIVLKESEGFNVIVPNLVSILTKYFQDHDIIYKDRPVRTSILNMNQSHILKRKLYTSIRKCECIAKRSRRSSVTDKSEPICVTKPWRSICINDDEKQTSIDIVPPNIGKYRLNDVKRTDLIKAHEPSNLNDTNEEVQSMLTYDFEQKQIERDNITKLIKTTYTDLHNPEVVSSTFQEAFDFHKVDVINAVFNENVTKVTEPDHRNEMQKIFTSPPCLNFESNETIESDKNVPREWNLNTDNINVDINSSIRSKSVLKPCKEITIAEGLNDSFSACVPEINSQIISNNVIPDVILMQERVPLNNINSLTTTLVDRGTISSNNTNDNLDIVQDSCNFRKNEFENKIETHDSNDDGKHCTIIYSNTPTEIQQKDFENLSGDSDSVITKVNENIIHSTAEGFKNIFSAPVSDENSQIISNILIPDVGTPDILMQESQHNEDDIRVPLNNINSLTTTLVDRGTISSNNTNDNLDIVQDSCNFRENEFENKIETHDSNDDGNHCTIIYSNTPTEIQQTDFENLSCDSDSVITKVNENIIHSTAEGFKNIFSAPVSDENSQIISNILIPDVGTPDILMQESQHNEDDIRVPLNNINSLSTILVDRVTISSNNTNDNLDIVKDSCNFRENEIENKRETHDSNDDSKHCVVICNNTPTEIQETDDNFRGYSEGGITKINENMIHSIAERFNNSFDPCESDENLQIISNNVIPNVGTPDILMKESQHYEDEIIVPLNNIKSLSTILVDHGTISSNNTNDNLDIVQGSCNVKQNEIEHKKHTHDSNDDNKHTHDSNDDNKNCALICDNAPIEIQQTDFENLSDASDSVITKINENMIHETVHNSKEIVNSVSDCDVISYGVTSDVTIYVTSKVEDMIRSNDGSTNKLEVNGENANECSVCNEISEEHKAENVTTLRDNETSTVEYDDLEHENDLELKPQRNVIGKEDSEMTGKRLRNELFDILNSTQKIYNNNVESDVSNDNNQDLEIDLSIFNDKCAILKDGQNELVEDIVELSTNDELEQELARIVLGSPSTEDDDKQILIINADNLEFDELKVCCIQKSELQKLIKLDNNDKLDQNICEYENNTVEPSNSLTDNDDFNQLSDDILQVTQEMDEYGNVKDIDIRLNVPKFTYSRKTTEDVLDYQALTIDKKNKRGLKRKADMVEVKAPERKYRKGKNIDTPKLTATTIADSEYSKEFKRLFDYCSSVKFSYSRPFHKEHIDVHKALESWPITDVSNPITDSHIDDNLFIDSDNKNSQIYDPLNQTLTEEIQAEYSETGYQCCHVIETNFQMGFGEGSDRVIQNSEDDDRTFSAATLSDVKQTQPHLLSACYNNSYNLEYVNSVNKVREEIETLKRTSKCIQLKDKIRSVFKKTMVELNNDWIKENKKYSDFCHNDSKVSKSDFPFGLNLPEFIKPPPIEVVMLVVQVGQLPVSGAAQNPVTCDPRVTQVSDASPSQCAADNNDDPQSVVKTEYTELTTADLSIPLQEYTHRHSQLLAESQDSSNILVHHDFTIEDIKEEIKEELIEEPDTSDEAREYFDTEATNNQYSPRHNSIIEDVDYSYDGGPLPVTPTLVRCNLDINYSSTNNSQASPDTHLQQYHQMQLHSNNQLMPVLQQNPQSVQRHVDIGTHSSDGATQFMQYNSQATSQDQVPNSQQTLSMPISEPNQQIPNYEERPAQQNQEDKSIDQNDFAEQLIRQNQNACVNQQNLPPQDAQPIHQVQIAQQNNETHMGEENMQSHTDSQNIEPQVTQTYQENHAVQQNMQVQITKQNTHEQVTNQQAPQPQQRQQQLDLQHSLHTHVVQAQTSTQNLHIPQQTNPEHSCRSEKMDQIAHAMSAAGIETTECLADTRAHTLVNILSQKFCQGSEGASPASNAYTKTTQINAMALQQALAQILPPPLNQTNGTENNPSSSTNSPQILHIVQGNNASGNQITLVDNSQNVTNTQNATPVLHIVQNKNNSSCVSSGGTSGPQTNSFSGLSLVDAGLQSGNQLLHIVNAGNQKNASGGHLLRKVNLLTNLANVQGSSEQKVVQIVCKSADGKSIQLNSPHPRGMVLRLQPVESPSLQLTQTKPIDTQELTSAPGAPESAQNKETGASQQEIKSRSVYEDNYAKFIQSSNKPAPENATSLPKFGQAFGKQIFLEGTQKTDVNSNSHLQNGSVTPDCPSNDNAMNLDHINSPPLLLRKSPQSSQAQPNLIQQLKQTMAPVNMSMHGGVIYTRQIPVNIGGGQTINLITVPSTDLVDDTTTKHQVINQEGAEQSIIKIVPQTSTSSSETTEDTSSHVPNDSPHTTQPPPVLTQMRIKLPMLSKNPQMVGGTRLVRPSFFQIQRNVIGGTNQQVYQQLVLTAAPPLGQQTIRLPQTQTTRKVSSESPSSSETQMSSSTLEQLREFDLVLEQVKERSTGTGTAQPNAAPSPSGSFSKIQSSSTDTTDSRPTASSTTTGASQQIVYSIGNTYVNRKNAVSSATTSSFVRSPDSSGIVDTPTSSTHQIRRTVSSNSSSTETPSSSTNPSPHSNNSTNTTQQQKAGKVKPKPRPKAPSNPPSTLKLPIPAPKPITQKPAEDEQTTQRILYILAEYKEQVENCPDKNKPAPRRRAHLAALAAARRKKRLSASRRSGRDMSPCHGEDTCRTMGSEDSSCGTSQGDNESCPDSHSPQESPRKIVRKITFDQETPAPVTQPRPQPSRNVIMADGQTITVARGTTGKPTTAVLMPANYILPVSMVKGGQQIAIVTNRGPKLLTVGGGEGGATNALLLQRLIGPGGLKPVLARPGVRHVRLPTAALQNLQAFNLTTSTTVQPPDSTASPAPRHNPPDLVDTRAASSPWRTERNSRDGKPDSESSTEGSAVWPNDYNYEETVRSEHMGQTVLDPIPDRYSPDMEAQRIFDKMFDVDSKRSYMISHDDSPRCGYDIDASDSDDKAYHQVVQRREGSSNKQHRLTHVSAAALRHKYAILEHELRLQKSMSEECEDLGVDSPSASDLFPEAELLFAASPAHEHTQDQAHHSHTPQPILNQISIPQPDMDDQIATDHLLQRPDHIHDHRDLGLGLEDVGIVTVSEDGMQATIQLDQEEFARSHPNTTFHSEPTEDGEVQSSFMLSSVKSRHITSTILHSNRSQVLVTAPQTTVISQATAESSGIHHNSIKYADIDNMINSIPVSHNNITLSSRFDSLLNDSRELHLTNTTSAIVRSSVHTTQVIRRVCYNEERRDTRFLIDGSDNMIVGEDAKMMGEDSREAMLGSIGGNTSSSPERHTELFWDSHSASGRADFSSDSDKCYKSPLNDNSLDSNPPPLGVRAHMRLDSVIKEARGHNSDDDVRPLRTYPAPRSASGKTVPTGTGSGKRRASGRALVKRGGCLCCVGHAPPKPKKPRVRRPAIDFAAAN